MVLPEMYIRLEVDGEKVKEYHLTMPYTKAQRNDTLRTMREIGKSREGSEVAIVFCPVESEPSQRMAPVFSVPGRKKVTPAYNSRERREARLAFVKERLGVFGALNEVWENTRSRSMFVRVDTRMVPLLKEARQVFGYHRLTSDMEIAGTLFRCYRKHMEELALQKIAEGL